MNKTSLRLKLAKMLLKFAMVETDKGVLNYEGELANGLELYVENENGEMVPAADGEYVITEDGRTIVVAEGRIVEIKEKVEETPAEEEAAPVEETMEGETGTTETVEEVITPNYEEIINTLLTAVEELTARIDAMAAEIAEMKKEAVEEEIDDQFSKKKPSKTGKKCWERI